MSLLKIMKEHYLHKKFLQAKRDLFLFSLDREDLEKIFESVGIPMGRSFPMVFDGTMYLGTLNEIKMAAARNTL